MAFRTPWLGSRLLQEASRILREMKDHFSATPAPFKSLFLDLSFQIGDALAQGCDDGFNFACCVAGSDVFRTVVLLRRNH